MDPITSHYLSGLLREMASCTNNKIVQPTTICFVAHFHRNERDGENCGSMLSEDDSGASHGQINITKKYARCTHKVKSYESVTEKNDPLTFYRNVYSMSFCLERANAHAVVFIY